MKKTIVSTFLLSSILMACTGTNSTVEKTAAEAKLAVMSAAENASDVEQSKALLLAKWEGPYQGVPAFDKVSLAGLIPAMEEAMKINLAEIDAIANNPQAPTFENTIVAMERTGKDLARVFTYYGIWRSNESSPEFREIQAKMAPTLSAFFSKINQNEALFARVQAVHNSDEVKSLTPEQQRLVHLTYNGFSRNGATLDGDAKKRYAEINQKLAELHTKFGDNVLADEENYVLYLTKDQLGGLSESLISSAASAAEARDHKGKYAITNTRSSMDPFLTYSTERELRQKVWESYYNRGNNGDEFDNNAIIAEILQLRHERVGLLGYKNYASWRLEDRMAKSPENAIKLMESVWPAAIARVDEEVADMLVIGKAEDGIEKIEPWDYRFYAEKVRKAKYDLDSSEVKEYLQLNKLREAMFYVAGRLFNFEFTEIKDGSVPVFNDDVRVWEVTDKTSNEHIGLWYLDPFARKGKRSGAWATTYRSYTTFDGKTNVLSSNNSNFTKGVDGEPTLISWSDAETYFHEFGHALHFLSAKVAYPTLNGGVRDYTEFQSQLLEHWLATDEVINNYLVHYKTGKPMPKELITKIKQAAKFNEGFKTTEYLASALVDMKFHTVDPTGIDAQKFERDTLAALNMPESMVMRHRSTQFGHIFSSEGYASSYYGYMWAEVLTADAAEAFEQSPGGFYDKDVAAKLVEHLFSVRNAVDPAEAYRAFRGRDADVKALMRDRGFPVTK
ncbi:M3 family metallopeptidase [Colwellia sp. 1_MG-2023]|uniref:M3 family metallopeptidase n=1 Tax=unclassified Colwellia TaxID=196834 RepID=UPI001C084236|nr:MULTISPECIES: M3 family metallopeptidase [unclassified Colwellia]MBU2926148.1 M3 family metallopeptidase [Colwellia sp. C2M11]MDO6652431.1 M3 family metallopeptidase [Colwellia sp. 3_MG-2023]MDO6665694.1 M3 family metallopeptidase [Colwellia sp. 2_MG-2023]MDO6690067.1 M3 family metallopeptidase [Colwellia sp. 1_MG-2023]